MWSITDARPSPRSIQAAIREYMLHQCVRAFCPMSWSHLLYLFLPLADTLSLSTRLLYLAYFQHTPSRISSPSCRNEPRHVLLGQRHPTRAAQLWLIGPLATFIRNSSIYTYISAAPAATPLPPSRNPIRAPPFPKMLLRLAPPRYRRCHPPRRPDGCCCCCCCC